MIRNYFKIAWRNLSRHRFYSLVNTIGLYLGVIFVLFIVAYVWGELQIHGNLKNSNRQYFLESKWKDPNMGIDFATLGPLAKQLKKNYPGLIKNYYRFDGISSIVSKDGNRFKEGIQIGDGSLLTMYGFKLLYGNKKLALLKPYSVVITVDKAIKYFGRKDVIGESIRIQNFSGDERDFRITGVLDKLSKNLITHVNGNYEYVSEFFTSTSALSFFGRGDIDSWTNVFVPSYIELKEGVTVEDIKGPIENLISKHASDRILKNLKVTPVLLSDYYLHRDNGFVKRMLTTLLLVGFFVLIMTLVNFINISINMSGSRIKEIGVRKLLGGIRKQLVLQFLVESFVLVLLASILVIISFYFLSPIYSSLMGVQIPELQMLPNYFILIYIVFILVVSLLAGLYPAFVLSSSKSIDSLNGTFKTKSTSLQKIILGFQFSLALLILISAFVITDQVDYFFNKNLGYNKDYIITAQVPRDWSVEGVKKMKFVRDEFKELSKISNASLSFEIPDGGYGHLFPIYRSGKAADDSLTMQSLTVDENYFQTYEIQLIDKDQLKNSQVGNRKVIINETAAIALGWENPMDAIGETLKINGDFSDYIIQNVAKDFHFETMKHQIQPIVFFNFNSLYAYRYLSFKIKPENIEEAIFEIEKKWKALIPKSPFDYHFMDATLSKLYVSEIQFKKMVYSASFLALIIVLLGLIALVPLSMYKRTKEIGIRKVLGASVLKIIAIFIKEFLFIILISSLVVIPFTYLIIENWLNNYAYRINISAQPFFIVIITLVSVTSILIGLLSFKMAISNPIKSLRTE